MPWNRCTVTWRSSEAAERRVTAIAAVGRIGSADSLPYLVAPLFAPRAGEVEMQAAARGLAADSQTTSGSRRGPAVAGPRGRRGLPWPSGHGTGPGRSGRRAGLGVPESQQPVATSDADGRGRGAQGREVVRRRRRLRPDDRSAVQRYLISRLEVDQPRSSGVDQPLRRGAGTAFDLVQQTGGRGGQSRCCSRPWTTNTKQRRSELRKC